MSESDKPRPMETAEGADDASERMSIAVHYMAFRCREVANAFDATNESPEYGGSALLRTLAQKLSEDLKERESRPRGEAVGWLLSDAESEDDRYRLFRERFQHGCDAFDDRSLTAIWSFVEHLSDELRRNSPGSATRATVVARQQIGDLATEYGLVREALRLVQFAWEFISDRGLATVPPPLERFLMSSLSDLDNDFAALDPQLVATTVLRIRSNPGGRGNLSAIGALTVLMFESGAFGVSSKPEAKKKIQNAKSEADAFRLRG